MLIQSVTTSQHKDVYEPLFSQLLCEKFTISFVTKMGLKKQPGDIQVLHCRQLEYMLAVSRRTEAKEDAQGEGITVGTQTVTGDLQVYACVYVYVLCLRISVGFKKIKVMHDGIMFKLVDFIFLSSFKFTEKMSVKYGQFPYTPSSLPQISSVINIIIMQL